MSNRAAAMLPQPALGSITSITERDFANLRPLNDNHLAPPTTGALGRALHAVKMGNSAQNSPGVGHALNDTPIGSAPSTAPSTAPGSPRL
jgi:6-phosphofructo-2-kinase